MKYVKTKILAIVITCLGLLMTSASVTADPIVDVVTTNPSSPVPQSTITITATISGDDITSVNVTVSECKIGLCFIYNIYPMSQNDAGDWVAEATLQDASGESTYIKYRFDVIDSGVEYTLDEDWKVNLTIENGNGDNGGNGGNGDGNGIPGFEIITLFAAIIIGIILVRRKRF